MNALITGGGSGIGRGIALALARRGVSMVLVGRRLEALQATAAEVQVLGGLAFPLAADLAHPAQRQALMPQACQMLGEPLECLIHNAGEMVSGPLLERSAEQIEQAVGVNLTAAIDLTRLALPDLIATYGSVVLVGSTAGRMPLPYASLYSASKAGLGAFAESLRYELEPLGVRLLLVYPPNTATAMTRGLAEAAGFGRFPLADPNSVGERIVAALYSQQQELSWASAEWALSGLYRLAPRLVRALFRTQSNRFERSMK
jgi:short-subunit dehydrogenase